MATIEDYARMCKAHGVRCVTRDCPISLANNGFKIACDVLLRKHPAEASAIIDKWCAEHPQKTYLQDFLDKFPKAKLCSDGTPRPCRNDCYELHDCKKHCPECWNEVIPDEEGGKQ